MVSHLSLKFVVLEYVVFPIILLCPCGINRKIIIVSDGSNVRRKHM